MKSKAFAISLLLSIAFSLSAIAQPYTLDQKIKPVKLELQDVKSKKGAKSIVANSTMINEPQYFYVNGCSMFQFIDIFIFSNFGSPNFTVELAKNTWNEVERTATTGGSKNGIVNFKLRTEGDFGFKIVPTGQKINYSIIIYASEPVEEFLGSAFKKADNETIEGGEDSASGGNSKSSGSSNTILYILLGVALLVIGFLASKVLLRKKTTMLLLLVGLGTSMSGFAQGRIETFGTGALDDGSYEEWLRDEVEAGVEALDEGLDRLGEVGDIIRDDERYRTVRDLYDSYTGLGDCISSVPPPGMPRVPSFCETDECGSCFVEARSDFNTTRYSFERLKTIYNCTKTFTDAAISFGDNVSGIHGVSGLAWQSERRKIEKSIKELQKAYDNKYRDLLEGQKRALMKLNECEAQHGIPDWYDRFGYMYYEFTAMHYKRPD